MRKLIIIGTLIILISFISSIIVFKTYFVDPENELVSELYSYLGSNDLEACAGLVNYDTKEIKANDISDDMKICLVYNIIQDKKENITLEATKKSKTCHMDTMMFAPDDYEEKTCTIKFIEEDILKEKYKMVFGTELEKFIDFQYDYATNCYYKEGEGYYCGLKKDFEPLSGNNASTYRLIKNVIKKKDELIINDYFLKIDNDICYQNYVTSNNFEKCTKEYDGTINYRFLKKYGTKYEHIFKKRDDKFYWFSSAPKN